MAWPPNTHQDVEDAVGALQPAVAALQLTVGNADANTAALVVDHTSQTGAVLGASFDAVGAHVDAGLNPGAHLLALRRGASWEWDSQIVESLSPFWDHRSGRWAGVYTGYGTLYGDSLERGAIGLAFSSDLTTWAKTGTPVLTATGNAGDPDQNGCSGPVVVFDSGTWHLFYIGLTGTGYEQGTKTLNLATTTSPPSQWSSGGWTRHGIVLTGGGTGWRAQGVWHPSIVKHGSTWYLFINATGTDGIERIGYATAPALTGPWTFDDANSPLIDHSSSGWDSQFVGDPCVYKVRDGWVMHYFGVNTATGAASDGIATTTDAAFPLGWAKHPANPILTPGPAGAFDSKYAHKPVVVQSGGRAYHFYTAVDTSDVRQVGVAISKAPTAPIKVTGTPTDPVLTSLLQALSAAGIITYGQTLLVSDTFTRADSTTTMGVTDTGQAWNVSGGTWGISGNQAYSATNGGQALVDAGQPVGKASVTLGGTMPSPGQSIGFRFRWVSSDVHYEVYVNGSGEAVIDQYNFGAANVATSTGAGFVTGDTLTVLDDGATLTVQRNGVTKLTYATTVAASASQLGLAVFGYGTGRFDNFAAYSR